MKCRLSGLTPNVSVLVATIRALKMHGGGPTVVAGRPLPKEYTEENLELLEKGCENLFHHVNTIKKSGIVPRGVHQPVYTDTDAEIALIRRLCAEHGVRCALSNHWRYGGEGAIELAETVIDACNESNEIKFLYPLRCPCASVWSSSPRRSTAPTAWDWAPLRSGEGQALRVRPQVRRLLHHDGQDPTCP